MSDNVLITSQTAGISIAAEDIGGVEFQRIKLADGQLGSTGYVHATTGVPGATATGLVVAVIQGVSVSAQVSGTVTVAGSVAVVPGVSVVAQASGTVTVNGSVAVVPGVSVVAQVSGAVSISAMPAITGIVGISAIVPVTTAASVSVSGLPVWLNPNQQVVVSGLAGHSITGSVNVVSTVVVAGSVAISGTGLVSVVPGVSVNALVTGVVSVSAMPSIAISVSQALGTIITILGTQVVTVVPGLSVSAVVSGMVSVSGYNFTAAGPSVAASGLVVWLAGGQSSTAFPVVITGTVTAGAGTTVVSGTVSVVNGVTVNVSGHLITTTGVTTGTAQAVWIMNPTAVTVTIAGTTTGTVSLLSIVPVTTQVSVSVSGIPVWMNPTQGVTIIGTQLASVVPGLSVSAVVSGTVSNSGMLFTTGLATVASTGQIVIPKDFARIPVLIVLGSTGPVAFSTTLAFTIWIGTTAPAVATTSYIIPAGQVLRIVGAAVGVRNSITTTPVRVLVQVLHSAGLPTQTTAIPVIARVGAAALTTIQVIYNDLPGLAADVGDGRTIAVAALANTSLNIEYAQFQGYLF